MIVLMYVVICLGAGVSFKLCFIQICIQYDYYTVCIKYNSDVYDIIFVQVILHILAYQYNHVYYNCRLLATVVLSTVQVG